MRRVKTGQRISSVHYILWNAKKSCFYGKNEIITHEVYIWVRDAISRALSFEDYAFCVILNRDVKKLNQFEDDGGGIFERDMVNNELIIEAIENQLSLTIAEEMMWVRLKAIFTHEDRGILQINIYIS